MADRDRDINIRVKVKDDGSVVLQTIGDKGKQSLESIDRQGKKANETLRSMDGLVAAVTTGFIGLAAVNVGRGLLETASSFEKLETRLTTIQGTSAAAKQSMSWITEFTAQTPYELAQVSDAFVKLNAYGFDAVKWMPMLGDTASSMGKGLNEAVEMFADATTGEFERLKEFGVRAKQEGDKATFSWVENGKQMTVSAQKNQAGISEALDQVFARFEGGMKAQATTWEGMTSNMADAWTAFKLDVMSAGIFDELKGGIEEVLVTAKRLKDDGTLKEWAGGITNAIFSIEAEAIRLAMLLDKIGGTMTMIPMGLFAPGAALGNDNSTAQFEKWAQRNIELEERYKAGDKALQDLADRQVAAQNQVATAVQHTTDVINTQTTTTGTATTKTKKQISEHEKYLDQITAKYLPLKAEAKEVEKAHQALAEQLAKGVITGSEYAVAMDNLYKSQTHVVESEKQAAKAAKDSHEAWQDQQEVIESLYQTSLPEYERALVQIEEKYTNLEDTIRTMVLSGEMAADVAARLQQNLAINKGIDLAAANKQINAFVNKHEEAADKVETVWDSAIHGLNSGLDEWERNGEMSAQSVAQAFSGAIRGIVADWGRGMATMDASSAKMQSIGSTAALYSTIAGSDSGYSGLLAGGVGIVNELYNPGSYANNLAGLQSSVAGLAGKIGSSTVVNGINLADNFGTAGVVNGPAGNFISGMSPGAFASSISGIGTFVTGLLSGQDFKQAAASGAGSAAGAYLGTMILPGIGTILGSMGGSFLGGLVGGDDEPEFTLNEWAPHIDSSYDRNTGIDKTQSQLWDGSGPSGAYLAGVDSLQAQLTAQAQQLSDQLSATASDAFLNALEVIDLSVDAEGRWAVADAQGALEDVLGRYAGKLDGALNTALRAALPAIAEELMGDDSVFALLTDEMQAKIRELINSDAFGVDQFGQLQSYFSQIAQATAPIDEIIATRDLSEYELTLRGIHQRFGALWTQLHNAGVDLEKYTDLEKIKTWALEDAAAANQKAIDQIKEEAAAKRAATISAAADDLRRAYSTEAAVFESSIEQFGRFAVTLRQFEQSLQTGSFSNLSPEDGYAEAKRQFLMVSNRAQIGDPAAIEQLQGVSQTFLAASRGYNASSAAYDADFATVTRVLDATASLSERHVSTAQQQLDALTSQVSALITINDSVQSVRDAILALTSASAPAALSAEERYLQNYPDVAAAVAKGQVATGKQHFDLFGILEGRTFGDGGDHFGGARIVGEFGPELELTGPSRIFNYSDTKRLLSGSSDDETKALLRAVITELSALVRQNGAGISASITRLDSMVTRLDSTKREIRRAANG